MASKERILDTVRDLHDAMKGSNWKKDESIVPKVRKSLQFLTTVDISVDLLQETKVGIALKDISKHENSFVRGFSRTLRERWKKDLAMESSAKKPPKDNSSRRGQMNGNSIPSDTSQKTSRSLPSSRRVSPDPERNSVSNSSSSSASASLALAREKLRSGYAAEKNKRDSRKLQVLSTSSNPKKRTVSSRKKMHLSTVMPITAKNTAFARPRTGIASLRPKTLPASRSSPAVRSKSASRDDSADRHRRKQEIMRERASIALKRAGKEPESGGLNAFLKVTGALNVRDGPVRSPTQVKSRSSTVAVGKRDPVRSKGATQPAPARPKTEFDMLLASKYPRIRGDAPSDPSAKKSASRTGKKPTGNENGATGTEAPEIESFLRRLVLDLSHYTPTFVNEGITNLKVLSTMKKSDIAEIVEKKGHQRLIIEGIEKLNGPSRRRDEGRSRLPAPKRRKRGRSAGYEEDIDSEDSFIASDDDIGMDGYQPGFISGLMRKPNRRPLAYDDGNDSSDMEATYGEIEDEEQRSREIARKEDMREDKRNKFLEEKKRMKKERR